jgi:hypothetical protein
MELHAVTWKPALHKQLRHTRLSHAWKTMEHMDYIIWPQTDMKSSGKLSVGSMISPLAYYNSWTLCLSNCTEKKTQITLLAVHRVLRDRVSDCKQFRNDTGITRSVVKCFSMPPTSTPVSVTIQSSDGVSLDTCLYSSQRKRMCSWVCSL